MLVLESSLHPTEAEGRFDMFTYTDNVQVPEDADSISFWIYRIWFSDAESNISYSMREFTQKLRNYEYVILEPWITVRTNVFVDKFLYWTFKMVNVSLQYLLLQNIGLNIQWQIFKNF